MLIAERNWSVVNGLKKIVAKTLQIKFCLRSTVGSTKTEISARHATKYFVQNRHTMVLVKPDVKIAEKNSQHWVTLLVTER